MTIMDLVTTKGAAECDLLFNKPASAAYWTQNTNHPQKKHFIDDGIQDLSNDYSFRSKQKW